MRSLSFLRSRRWALLAVAVLLLAYLAWWLGEWQFHRLEDRRDRNAIVAANVTADPVPIGDLVRAGGVVDAGDEWRRVSATGVYDTDNAVVVRYRTRDGVSGIEIVVPLITADGTAVLVDRGWMESDNRGVPSDVPVPEEREVTVTGWLRVDAVGRGIRVTDHSTRAVSSVTIGETLGRDVYPGFVDLESEEPDVGAPLAQRALPELNEGPHFFYGLQWWFFGVLAIFGIGYLAYDEWRRQQQPRAPEAAPEQPE